MEAVEAGFWASRTVLRIPTATASGRALLFSWTLCEAIWFHRETRVRAGSPGARARRFGQGAA